MQNTVSMPIKTKWKSSFAMLVARPNFHFQVHSLFLSQFKNKAGYTAQKAAASLTLQ